MHDQEVPPTREGISYLHGKNSEFYADWLVKSFNDWFTTSASRHAFAGVAAYMGNSSSICEDLMQIFLCLVPKEQSEFATGVNLALANPNARKEDTIFCLNNLAKSIASMLADPVFYRLQKCDELEDVIVGDPELSRLMGEITGVVQEWVAVRPQQRVEKPEEEQATRRVSLNLAIKAAIDKGVLRAFMIMDMATIGVGPSPEELRTAIMRIPERYASLFGAPTP